MGNQFGLRGLAGQQAHKCERGDEPYEREERVLDNQPPNLRSPSPSASLPHPGSSHTHPLRILTRQPNRHRPTDTLPVKPDVRLLEFAAGLEVVEAGLRVEFDALFRGPARWVCQYERSEERVEEGETYEPSLRPYLRTNGKKSVRLLLNAAD